MKVIDAEGRLLGRLNLVDAAIGGFVALLVPLAIAAVFLFRAPTPVITSVEAAPLSNIEERAAQGTLLAGKLKVRGSGLRPILRVEIGGQAAVAFIFESPSSADVLYGALPAGTHDLVLFDGVQEVARARGAVTIPEQSTTVIRVRAVGTFIDLSEEAAKSLRPGTRFPTNPEPDVEIVALGDPEPARFTLNGNTDVLIPDRWQRAGVAVVRCHLPSGQVRECRLRGTLLDAGNVLPLPGSTSRLLIEEVQPDADVTAGELCVRFIGHASVIDLLRVGDRDREQWVLDGRGAIIRSLDARRSVTGTVAVGVLQEAGSPSAEAQVTGPLVALDAVLSVGLDRARAGWRYRTHEIRAGGPFTLTTPAYVVRGVVLAIGVPPARTSDAGGGK